MKVAIDEVFHFDCITSHPTTGAATDADSTPTFAVYEEATDTDIGVGGNLTKRTSLTGNYRGSFTASAANGFEAGKWYSVIASATVNSVAGKATVAHFQCVPAESSAGVPKVDLTHVAGATTDVSALATNVAAILVDTGTTLDGRIPAALVGGRMDSSVGAMADNVMTAAAAAADLGTELAAAVWNALTSGMSTSGSIGKKLADWAIHSAADVWSVATRVLSAGTNIGFPTAAQNADAVWDEPKSDHTTPDTFGDYLDDEITSRGTGAALDAAGVRSAVGLASADLDTQLGALPTAVENADALLGRNIAGGSSTGRTVSTALYVLRNRVAISGGTMTVYETDDTTSSWTAAATGDAAAEPIIEMDPA